MTTPSVSGAWPLYKAIAAAIGADAPTVALLHDQDSIYNVAAPKGADLSYIVLGTVSETGYMVFLAGASSLTMMLHLWTPGPDGATCAQLYAQLHRALDRQSLELEGFGPAAAFLSLVDIAGDPQDETAHGVARLELTAFAS